MRKLDIFCPSQAATATRRLTMELPSPSSSSACVGGSSPAIDRYNPIIRDSRRCGSSGGGILLPPLPLRHKKKNHKVPLKEKEKENKNKNSSNDKEMKSLQVSSRKSWSCTKPTDFISPPGSTRYLLNGNELLHAFSDFDAVFPPPSNSHSNPDSKDVDINEPCHEKPASSSSSSPSPDQVVVLRVSLHCRGCERKMRKHISRMEGVRSFNIDFAAKKVTVSGKVTPLEVLSSISKVKNAQLWPPTISSQSKGTTTISSASASASPSPSDWDTDQSKGTTTFVGVAS